MRKKELVKILQEIPGNPEVLLYNGFTGDWHHISIEDGELSRVKSHWQKKFIAMERFKKDGKGFPSEDELAEEVRKIRLGKRDFEFNDYAHGNMYEFKKVKLICGKPRGKSTFDRLGSVKY